MSKTISNTEKRETTSSPKFKLQTFRALRYPDYRLLWISLIVSSIGTWMQISAQSKDLKTVIQIKVKENGSER